MYDVPPIYHSQLTINLGCGLACVSSKYFCQRWRWQNAHDVRPIKSWPLITANTIWASWDTRSPLDPKAKVEVHESEILAVAFSPASEHLLVTGSADKVCVTCKYLYCSSSYLLFIVCDSAWHSSCHQTATRFWVSHRRSPSSCLVSTQSYHFCICF